jgi:hypothetical protein
MTQEKSGNLAFGLNETTLVHKKLDADSVTRLGEFSHIWATVLFGQFYENYRKSHVFGSFFTTDKLL